MTKINNLSKLDDIIVLNDPKYWKDGERDQFFKRVTRTVDKNYVEEGFWEERKD